MVPGIRRLRWSLAALFEAARDFARAAEDRRLAAERAAQLFASQEAVVLARRGLALLQSVPDSRERQHGELALLVSLGNALIATRGYAADEVLDTYTRAHELCRQVGETPHLSAVLYGFAALYRARQTSDRTALRQGSADIDRTPAGSGGRRRSSHGGWPLLAMGRLEEACTHFEAVRAIFEPALHRPLAYSHGQEPGMSSRICLAITLWLLGEADEAQRCRDESLELGRQTAHANSQCYSRYFAAMYDQLRGDRAAARANVEALLKLAEDQGLALWLGWSAVLRGWTVAADGDLATGAAEMRRGIDAAHATGAALCHTYHLGLLAGHAPPCRTIRRSARHAGRGRSPRAGERGTILGIRSRCACAARWRCSAADLEGAAEYLGPCGRDRSTSGRGRWSGVARARGSEDCRSCSGARESQRSRAFEPQTLELGSSDLWFQWRPISWGRVMKRLLVVIVTVVSLAGAPLATRTHAEPQSGGVLWRRAPSGCRRWTMRMR